MINKKCSICFWSILEIRKFTKTPYCVFIQQSMHNIKIKSGECSHHDLDKSKVEQSDIIESKIEL